MYRLTGSTFLVGVVDFAQFAAVPVLAPGAGAAADRFDRPRLVVVTLLTAVGLAALLTMPAASAPAPPPIVIAPRAPTGSPLAITIPDPPARSCQR